MTFQLCFSIFHL